MKTGHRSLHVFVLCGFAVAQPVYDLLARNAGFFVVRGSQPIDIVLLALLLSFVLPALVTGLLGAARLMGARVEQAVLGAFGLVLVAATVMPALKRISALPGSVAMVVATGLGAAAAFAYCRFASARTFVTVLMPAVILFPSLFLFVSPVARIVRPGPKLELDLPATAATAPVVMVIFDELPLVSLLDERGRLDAARYPNLAAFARDATWFRNATTVSGSTHLAVPAILQGRFPHKESSAGARESRLPIAADYPQTLFTLLGGSYDMEVFESQTRLCPPELCGKNALGRGLGERLGPMLWDVGVAYLHIVVPPGYLPGLPSVSTAWANFANHDASQDRLREALESSPETFARFLASFDAGRTRPALHFLHVVLPHAPWTLLPSGRAYTRSRSVEGLLGDKWAQDERLVADAYQRHLLQVGFVDTLVGELVARLKAKGLYDRSLIALMADHGAGFAAGANRRSVTKDNLAEIMAVPLIMKAPHQVEGRVDDGNVESVDILPTVADFLGVALPWSVDGRSASGVSSDRRKTKLIIAADRSPGIVVTPETAWQATTDAVHRLAARFVSERSIGGPHPELRGRPYRDRESTGAPGVEVILTDRQTLKRANPDAGIVPAHVAGRILLSDGHAPPFSVAVSVNGVIQTTARAWLIEADEAMFSAFVPEESLRRGPNEIAIHLVTSADGALALHPTRLVSSPAVKRQRRRDAGDE